MGLKDEITSALDQHEDDAKSGLENNSNGSNGDFLNGETGDFDVGVGGGGGVGVGEGEGISEETDLIRKFSDEDASGSQVPTVSLEEALQLVGLDVSKSIHYYYYYHLHYHYHHYYYCYKIN